LSPKRGKSVDFGGRWQRPSKGVYAWCQKARIPGSAIRSDPKKTHMDTTTLLIIVLLVLLFAGGGWYGRGRWY
jgi:hypothetical protein